MANYFIRVYFNLYISETEMFTRIVHSKSSNFFWKPNFYFSEIPIQSEKYNKC